jgi:hypothetical protein
MTRFLLIFLLSILTSVLSAQSGYYDYISFETPDSTLDIDTSLAENIWQIGTPHKPKFDSALSSPNVMITDTINYYPPNNFSTFTIKIFDPAWGLVYCDEIDISFKHMYDTDSLKDGGYIEISYDNGITWKNIIDDSVSMWMPCFYDYYGPPYPTIANGNAAFTGRSNGWENAYIGGCGGEIFFNPDPVYLRFVFSSDSLQTNKEGWMIDNLFLSMGCWCCLSIKESHQNNSILIVPNPVSDKMTITVTQKSDLEILNIDGKLLEIINNVNKETIIDVKSFQCGVYILRAKTDKGIVIKRFIKE